ncbi:quinon protein alcohol dehydrogenase-like superfamily, partial [Favolaschia claudopus]
KKSYCKVYTPCGTLTGHRGAVHRLAVTEDCKLLASGGIDGTRVWDLKTSKLLESPAGAGGRGATTCLLWIRRENESRELLFYEMYCKEIFGSAELTGLAFDPASNRLALCTASGVVQSYTLDRTSNLQPLFTIPMKGAVPKAIAFGDYKNTEREVIVFTLYDGSIRTLRGVDGSTVKTRFVGGKIGGVAINSRKGLMCLEDPFEGAVLYRLDDDHKLKTFEIALTQEEARPRQVCFADDGGAIVCGSDHGAVYVLDHWNGELLDQLQVGTRDWVQAVTAADIDGISTIFAARSGELGGRNDIMIWKKMGRKKSVRAAGILANAFQFLLILIGVLFIWQNMPKKSLRCRLCLIRCPTLMPRHYTCTCALRPNPHQILRVKRDDHDREYAELIESEKIERQVDAATATLEVDSTYDAENAEHHGVRWSEMWRLPYWNPSRMLVIDAMHCILEGLVHYHC